MRLAPLALLAGCLEVSSGEDCLVVTEVSVRSPGLRMFDFSCRLTDVTCSVDNAPDAVVFDPVSGAPLGFCPDYVELCNFTQGDISLDPYYLANDQGGAEPNPFAPDEVSLGAVFGATVPPLEPGACVALPSHSDREIEEVFQKEKIPPCATASVGFEMETGGRIALHARIGSTRRCEQDLTYPGMKKTDPDSWHRDPDLDVTELTDGAEPSPGIPW